MPSSLPSGDAGSKAVKDFGIGTYDALLDSESHGEDDEETEPAGPSLPEGGGYEGPFLEYWLSYPTEEALGGKHASGMLPGDVDRPPRSPRPADDTFGDVLPTSGPPAMGQDGDGDEDGEEGSKLPSGHWPAARADYYDTMTMGTAPSTTDMWAGGDSGAYVSQEGEDGEDGGGSQLPGSGNNDASMDDFLGALGNMWSGFVVEDQSDPRGFPSEDYKNVWDGGGPSGGTVLAHIDASNTTSETDEDMSRTATDLQLVGDLSKEFMKEFGKKDLVRRHVLAFLQDKGLPQYLASDIIRCLKHRHSITMADVMDLFPVKTASGGSAVSSFASMRERFIQGEIDNISQPEVSSKFRRCAADLAHVIVGLEKLEG